MDHPNRQNVERLIIEIWREYGSNWKILSTNIFNFYNYKHNFLEKKMCLRFFITIINENLLLNISGVYKLLLVRQCS